MTKTRQLIRYGISGLLVIFALQFSLIAMARDNAQRYSIADAMATATAKSMTGVQFYFGSQGHPAVKRSIGNYTTRRSTNAFGKSDAASCQWGFLSAVKTLYERALAEGGNAVINIKSVTTNQAVNSSSEFVCRAGNVVSRVYLNGDVVKL